jgi:multidrug efflux pump
VVTLSFNLAPGASLGAAVEHIRDATKEVGHAGSIEPTFQGTAAAFEKSLASEPILILAAIVTVYIVLGCCTKATFTRSRFSRRCLRRAWAPSWR